MFKKNAWIAVLLAALVMMFVSCIDAAEEEEGEMVEIFRLSKVIADAQDGALDSDDTFNAVFANTPIMKCGPLSFSIITEKGVKKLKLDGMTNTWGEGLDLYNTAAAGTGTAKNSGIGYRTGDTITIKGTASAEGVFFNGKGGAYADLGAGWKAGTEFDKTITLTAADVGTIRTGSPQVIRIHFHDGYGDSRRGTIIFEEIVVEGNRSQSEDTFADDFEITDRLQVANWVNGLTITPKKGKSGGDIIKYYEGTSYPKSTTPPQVVGEYDVTFDVAAIKGFNAATGLEAGKMKVLPVVLPAFTVSGSDLKIKRFNCGAWDNVDGKEDLEARITGPDGAKDWVFMYNTLPATVNWATVNPLAIRNFTTGLGVSRYCVWLDSSWKNYEQITVTLDFIATTVQSGADAGKAQMITRRNQGEYAWADGDLGYPEVALSASGVTTASFSYDVSNIDNGNNITSLMFGPNNTTAFLVKIKSITYGYK